MSLCSICRKADVSCPVYPQDTFTCCEFQVVDLKPCPFCGGEDAYLSVVRDDSRRPVHMVFGCDDTKHCPAEAVVSDYDGAALVKMVTLWNTRFVKPTRIVEWGGAEYALIPVGEIAECCALCAFNSDLDACLTFECAGGCYVEVSCKK